jgi:haloalkane dehalogenase
MAQYENVQYEKKFLEVLGKKMAYIEEGEGDPIVFLHGNPTSSYLWRNIIPHLSSQGRCIAPDLIGMGDSEKLDASGPDSYTFVEHRSYLNELLDQLNVTSNVVLVIHDWGSALGFDWANRNQEAMQGIAYMEAIVRPIEWSEWPEDATPIFQGLRSAAGEEMILEKNLFVEAILPGSILRKLSEKEMQAYREPFANEGEGRRPTLTWPRQIPLGGEPADVVKVVGDYAKWLSQSTLPKLLIKANPGAILNGAVLEYARTWPNQKEVEVAGSHFIQEDSPDEIGAAISDFVAGLRG